MLLGSMVGHEVQQHPQPALMGRLEQPVQRVQRAQLRIDIGVVADVVSVVGFPFGIAGGGSLAIWATGFIASEPDINYKDLPVFLIDSRSRPGQSGSPVVAHRNGGPVLLEDNSTHVFAEPVTRFLGVYSGRINQESDLGMVWKADALTALIGSI